MIPLREKAVIPPFQTGNGGSKISDLFKVILEAGGREWDPIPSFPRSSLVHYHSDYDPRL